MCNTRDRWSWWCPPVPVPLGRCCSTGSATRFPTPTRARREEWLDSFDAIVDARGRARARYLLMKLLERARTKQVDFPATVSTPYVNTIPADAEPWFPGDEYQERRIRAYIRWNAAAMVTRANTRTEGIGGHLSTYASSAALYEVGFNHFFRGKADGGFGDQVYFQGHASPGIYARAYVEGRLTEAGARQLPPRGRRRRPAQLPAPPLAAGLLGVPDRLHGARADRRHLPGPRQPLPAPAPPRRHQRQPGLVLRRRRRDGRARVDRRAGRGRARAPRQPDLRRQLQPAAARRAGPRQRQDHPGARGRLPWRRLERDQGHLGLALGRAAWPRTSTASCWTA